MTAKGTCLWLNKAPETCGILRPAIKPSPLTAIVSPRFAIFGDTDLIVCLIGVEETVVLGEAFNEGTGVGLGFGGGLAV